ncbi:HvfC/BufC N-terminal domain-containing protein [Lignipirellula cremea]|uniref:Putative DNA-binding domain-containing protein n=1 Tax=Lignipirellula cremea TaxID=2528010 RepID=A0A518DXE3_9BACT|nr:DNA-binding domain-containing protein [Lignipirellula cremea]QDU96497.1 hypothetical protein Pla8534_43180 [Lignipirellula cremea]
MNQPGPGAAPDAKQPPRDLGVVQRWMQAVITHPDGVAQGLTSEAALAEIAVAPIDIEQVVMRSHSLTSVERLAVYGNAYFARLLECMRELFPALAQALSEEVFDSFSFGYLQQHPSRSYTLERLADHFVPFLEETRPSLQEPGDDPDAPSWPDFVIDLARLEWTIDRVFDGPGVEQETPLAVADLQAIPPEQWADACLEPVVCLHLLAFRYPVNDYYTAWRQGGDAPLPDPRPSYVAITRRDYVVRRYELSQPQYSLLSSLASGQSLGEATAQAAESFDSVEALAESLQNWFAAWSAQRFFQRVTLGEESAPPDDLTSS